MCLIRIRGILQLSYQVHVSTRIWSKNRHRLSLNNQLEDNHEVDICINDLIVEDTEFSLTRKAVTIERLKGPEMDTK